MPLGEFENTNPMAGAAPSIEPNLGVANGFVKTNPTADWSALATRGHWASLKIRTQWPAPRRAEHRAESRGRQRFCKNKPNRRFESALATRGHWASLKIRTQWPDSGSEAREREVFGCEHL
jgi:hypothetical protein